MKSQSLLSSALFLILTGLSLSACESNWMQTREPKKVKLNQLGLTVPQPPKIAAISDQTTLMNTALLSIPVVIDDPDSTLNCGQDLKAYSTQMLLVDSGDISFSGSFPNCEMSISPKLNQRGKTHLFIEANDGLNVGYQTFELFVGPFELSTPSSLVSFHPTADTTIVTPITLQGWDGEYCDEALSFNSSNAAVVDPALAEVSGIAPACSVEFTVQASPGQTQLEVQANYLGQSSSAQWRIYLMPPAQTALALRKIKLDYSGPAIRVRRSSDQSEINVGFLPDGNLDTATLLNFVGAADGLVVHWFDQASPGMTASQLTSTRQPAIVIGGVLQTQNGRPSVRFDGNSDILSMGLISPLTLPITVSLIHNNVSYYNYGVIFSNLSTNTIGLHSGATGQYLFNGAVSTLINNQTNLNLNETTIYYRSSGLSDLFRNGGASIGLNPGTSASILNGFNLGGVAGPSNFLNGRISEFILAPGTWNSSDRLEWSAHQRLYFSI
jgi:hypothetical protein